MTCVHFQGTIPDTQHREALLRELTACAKSMEWGCLDVDDRDAGLAGVVLQPTNKLEPIPFLFDAEGRLHALGDLLMPDGEPILWVSVKTHYAGTEGHEVLIRFLRHIQTRFMPELRVEDESGFWEHQDEAKLKAYFEMLDRFADRFSDHLLNDVALSPDADAEALLRGITHAAELTHRQTAD